jgi:hypothetical protein
MQLVVFTFFIPNADSRKSANISDTVHIMKEPRRSSRPVHDSVGGKLVVVKLLDSILFSYLIQLQLQYDGDGDCPAKYSAGQRLLMFNSHTQYETHFIHMYTNQTLLQQIKNQ